MASQYHRNSILSSDMPAKSFMHIAIKFAYYCNFIMCLRKLLQLAILSSYSYSLLSQYAAEHNPENRPIYVYSICQLHLYLCTYAYLDVAYMCSHMHAHTMCIPEI